jgi:hypothetical protein
MPELPNQPDPLGVPGGDGIVPQASRRKPAFRYDPPPASVVRLGLGAGALEGLIAGWIYGGFGAIFFSILSGGVIGSLIGIIAWRTCRHTSGFIRPFLFGMMIEALGGAFIVLASRFNVPFPIEFWVFIISSFIIVIPFASLYLRLIRREIIAAYRGTIAGAIVGAISLGIMFGGMCGEGFGGIFAIMLFVLGGIGGVGAGTVFGCLVGSLLGGLVGALVNVTRSTIAPTYGGLAAAIGLGIAGHCAGEEMAGDLGGLIGMALGVGYGSLAGIKVGKLATPLLVAVMRCKEEDDPKCPSVLDLSSARQIADAEPIHRALAELLLLAIRSRIQWILLEQREAACIATLLTENASDSYSWPLPPELSLISVLKKMTRIGANGSSALMGRQDRRLHLHLKPHLLEVALAFQTDRDAERIDLRWYDVPDIVERAERISNTLRFIVKARANFDVPVYLGRGSA